MLRLLAMGAAWGLGLCAASTAWAGAVLYLDFMVETQPPQTGFVGCAASIKEVKTPVIFPVKSAFNEQQYTLILTSGRGKDAKGDFNDGSKNLRGRTRQNTARESAAGGGYTYYDIYHDFVTLFQGPLMGIEIKGLAPHTPYQVTFYCYDSGQSATDGRNVRFYDLNGPDERSFGPPEGLIFVGHDDNLTNSKYMVSAISRASDAQGRLFFVERATNGPTILNAILIDEAPRGREQTAGAPTAAEPTGENTDKSVSASAQVSTEP